jgi:hypothetical protein
MGGLKELSRTLSRISAKDITKGGEMKRDNLKLPDTKISGNQLK